jgi:hypothetical protein
VAQHVKILGILHIIFGALGVLGALVVLLVLGGVSAMVGMSDHSADSAAAAPIIGAIGVGVCILILVISLPGLIAGIGLVQLRSWARILTLIVSGFELLSIPLGTALGIYGFWVLMNPETERMFASQAVRTI